MSIDEELEYNRYKVKMLNRLLKARKGKIILSKKQKAKMMKFFIFDEEYEYCAMVQKL